MPTRVTEKGDCSGEMLFDIPKSTQTVCPAISANFGMSVDNRMTSLISFRLVGRPLGVITWPRYCRTKWLQLQSCLGNSAQNLA